jgi:hypothetical protein
MPKDQRLSLFGSITSFVVIKKEVALSDGMSRKF